MDSRVERARILGLAERVLRLEAESVLALVARLDDRFVDAVGLLQRCRGRVIVTGMGKSGLIGRKIAATLASTGTPAYFLHPPRGCTAISAWSRGKTWCWRCPTRGRPTRCSRCCPR
jgi:DNA-binding MurR/RpiR family transcriptional regulator